MPIETLALFATIELATSNVLEPWLYGAHTGLSPVALMVATIFWTWLWGGAGLLLATPLTVCVAVIGKYIPSMSFLDAILGDEPTLTVNDRYYQRLLALDRPRGACGGGRVPEGPRDVGSVFVVDGARAGGGGARPAGPACSMPGTSGSSSTPPANWRTN